MSSLLPALATVLRRWTDFCARLLLAIWLRLSSGVIMMENRNIVDASAQRDLRDASAYENYALPKLYIKQYYSIEAAVHQRIVRVRSTEARKIRTAPVRHRARRD